MFCGCTHLKKCEQLFSKEEIPFIFDNDYHECLDVFKNFHYLVRNSDSYLEHYPYPYSTRLGDTIKVCGFTKYWYGRPVKYYDSWWECDLTDDSLYAIGANDNTSNLSTATIRIFGYQEDCLDSVDFSKKCYLTGYMTFDKPFSGEIGFLSEPGACWQHMPYFQVIEIRN